MEYLKVLELHDEVLHNEIRITVTMLGLSWVFLSLFAATAYAGDKVWSGSFNNFTSAADFDKC